MISAKVTVGIGAWKASTEVELCACPHVGDGIIVKGTTVICERVYIGKHHVYVEETIRFASEADAKDHQAAFDKG